MTGEIVGTWGTRTAFTIAARCAAATIGAAITTAAATARRHRSRATPRRIGQHVVVLAGKPWRSLDPVMITPKAAKWTYHVPELQNGRSASLPGGDKCSGEPRGIGVQRD